MSVTPELRASARSTYRLLFRTAARTFSGTKLAPTLHLNHTYKHFLTTCRRRSSSGWLVLNGTRIYFLPTRFLSPFSSVRKKNIAFREKIRTDFREGRSIADSKTFTARIQLGREIADVLKKNVVQGVRINPEVDTNADSLVQNDEGIWSKFLSFFFPRLYFPSRLPVSSSLRT